MVATLFHGGTVWRGPGRADAHALLVRDGRVVAFDRAALRMAAGAERVDLAGGFLMPSFGDGHAHPLFGGLEAEGPRIRDCTSVAEIVAEVARYAAEHPELPWIFGASYDGSLAESGLFDARWLDQAVGDRPVVLRAWDYHTMWVNSKALELAGIEATTPDPVLGEIPRRGDGSPLGILREWGATDLVMAAAPVRPEEQRMRALRTAGEYYLARGVTWVQDAWVEPGDVDTYLTAAEHDLLPLRMNLALYADPRSFASRLADLIAARDRVRAAGHPLLSCNTVKFFADGVVENETGALLQPYCSGLHDHGMQVWGPGPALADAVSAVDAAGFQVHIHAIGDRAVRQALDAIEVAVAENGPRDRRPVIAHAQLIDGTDLGRFAELGVVACMQPLWAQLDALMNVLTVPRLGQERSDRQYRMRSVLESAAVLAFGSDWPCSSGDPREGIAIATTRQTLEDGNPPGGWTPDEIVPMEQSLQAYSAACAFQAFGDVADAPWGELRPGAAADLVQLARDPRLASGADLPHNAIVATFIDGCARYRADA
jgi:predicted amidohydrolase YtcJ